MKNRRIFHAGGLLIGLIACVTSFPIAVRADSIIIDTFGPGHSYQPRTGLTIAGSQSMAGSVQWGQSFTTHAKISLTQITMGLGWVAGVNGVRVSLDTNRGGVPGIPLTSWSFSGLPKLSTTNSLVQTITFAPGIVLQSGQTYWLVAAPFAANTQAAWNFNPIGLTSIGAVNFGNGWLTTNITSGAFEVRGKAVVPEPGSSVLLVTGLLGMVAAAVRKKAAGLF